MSGLISTVHVDAGDRVEKGEPLIDLDRAVAELDLRRARAAVTEAQAHLTESIRLRDEARELISGRSISESQALAAQAREAVLSRVRAKRAQQAETVRRHTIIAPFPGVISRKRTEAGEWVQPGAAVLDLIADRKIRPRYRGAARALSRHPRRCARGGTSGRAARPRVFLSRR